MNLFVGRPNFIQLLGFRENPYWIITPYFQLGSLQSFLRRPDFVSSMSTILAFAMDISLCVQEMHRLGLAHADLKLVNIFVDYKSIAVVNDIIGADGGGGTGCGIGGVKYRCVIADMGLAQILDESQVKVHGYQVTNIRGFTIAYASPDCIIRFRTKTSGKPEEILRADVYALAIIFYEMLDGVEAWEI